MEVTAGKQRRIAVAILAGCVLFLAAWIVVARSKTRPIERRISVVQVSKTGRWLAAGTPDGKIFLSDQTRARQINFAHGVLNDLQFSPDESRLAIAAESLGVYSLRAHAAPNLIRSDRRNYGTVQFSEDGRTILTVTGQSFVETLDARSGAAHLKLCCSSIGGEVAFSPDGHFIVNAGHWPSVWDAQSGRLLGRLTANREFLTFLCTAFDTSRQAVLMGSQDGRVYMWDVLSRRLLARSAPQPEYVNTLVVLPSGWVGYAAFGRIVRWWHPASGQQRSWPEASPTSNLALTPDGASVVFGTSEGAVEFWDLRHGQRERIIHHPGF